MGYFRFIFSFFESISSIYVQFCDTAFYPLRDFTDSNSFLHSLSSAFASPLARPPSDDVTAACTHLIAAKDGTDKARLLSRVAPRAHKVCNVCSDAKAIIVALSSAYLQASCIFIEKL